MASHLAPRCSQRLFGCGFGLNGNTGSARATGLVRLISDGHSQVKQRATLTTGELAISHAGYLTLKTLSSASSGDYPLDCHYSYSPSTRLIQARLAAHVGKASDLPERRPFCVTGSPLHDILSGSLLCDNLSGLPSRHLSNLYLRELWPLP
jgi:hypothetical protein